MVSGGTGTTLYCKRVSGKVDCLERWIVWKFVLLALTKLDSLAATSATAPGLQGSGEAFDLTQDYLHQDQLHGLEGRPRADGTSTDTGPSSSLPTRSSHFGPQWALLRFEQPITAPQVQMTADSGLPDLSLSQSIHMSLTKNITTPQVHDTL